MDEDIPKNPAAEEKSDPCEDKHELKPEQPITDKDSGQGTVSNGKSSGTGSQASDSTSGIEVQLDEADEKPLILDSPLNPEPSTSWMAAGASPKKSPKKPGVSPKKSPARKVQEGLSWVKKHLSPKKKCRSTNIESSDSLNVSSSPKKSLQKSPKKSLQKSPKKPPQKSPNKSPQRSPKKPPQKSPNKSPQKTPKKSPFKLKLKSPSKKEKRAPADEVQPFLPDDELRRYSSSDEDNATAGQTSKQGAIPKNRRSKKGKERNPNHSAEQSTEKGRFTKKDRTSSDKAAKEAREKLKQKVQRSIAKKVPPVETPAVDDFEKFTRYPKPCSSRSVSGTWSQLRCTTDEEYTGTPSEIDLSSISSYKFAESSDQAESRESPAVEQVPGCLDSVTDALDERSVDSAAQQLARHLNLSDPDVSVGGDSSASQVDEIPEISSSQVPLSDSGRQAEPENGTLRNRPLSHLNNGNRFSRPRELKNQRKKEKQNRQDSDEES